MRAFAAGESPAARDVAGLTTRIVRTDGTALASWTNSSKRFIEPTMRPTITVVVGLGNFENSDLVMIFIAVLVFVAAFLWALTRRH